MSVLTQSPAPTSPKSGNPIKNVLLRPTAEMRRRIDFACGLTGASAPVMVFKVLDRELPSLEQINKVESMMVNEEGTR